MGSAVPLMHWFPRCTLLAVRHRSHKGEAPSIQCPCNPISQCLCQTWEPHCLNHLSRPVRQQTSSSSKCRWLTLGWWMVLAGAKKCILAICSIRSPFPHMKIPPWPSNSLLLTASNSWNKSSQLPRNVRKVWTLVLDRFQCLETRIKMRVSFTSASAQAASPLLWTRTTTSSRKICSRKRHSICTGSKKSSTRCTYSKTWWCKRCSNNSRVRVARVNNSIFWLSQWFLLKRCTSSYQITSSKSWPCKDNSNNRLLLLC